MPSLRLLSPPIAVLLSVVFLAVGPGASPARARNALHLSRLGGPSDLDRPVSLAHSYSSATESPRHHFVVTQIWSDLRYLAGQPDFVAVLGGLSLGPGVFHSAFNNESPEFTEAWGKSRFADDFFEAGETYGRATLPISVSAAAWSAGKLGGLESLRAFGSDLFRAQAVTGIFALSLKAAINRTRPNGAPYAYPSGHTSSAFATAGVVYRHFGARAGIPAFMAAAYVGFSRLQENKHYLTDVIAGGILGSFVSLKLAGRESREAPVSIAPYAGHGGEGLALTIRF
jgi:membrane-associated phospholipid phosphatase